LEQEGETDAQKIEQQGEAQAKTILDTAQKKADELKRN